MEEKQIINLIDKHIESKTYVIEQEVLRKLKIDIEELFVLE